MLQPRIFLRQTKSQLSYKLEITNYTQYFLFLMFEDEEQFLKGIQKSDMEKLLQHIKTIDGYEAPEPKIEGMLEADYGLDKRREVSELQYPLCCVGAVVFDGGHGTGCLIGKNFVLTCAHVCYSRENQKKKNNMKFHPAINRQHVAKNGYAVKHVHYDLKYEEKVAGDLFQIDLAVLELHQNIGEDYGFVGVDFSAENILVDQQFMMYGYSERSQNKFTFQMLQSPGVCKTVDNNFISYKESTNYGQSGGPIITQKAGSYYIVGVHIKNAPEKKQNEAVHLTEDRINIINSWVGKRYFPNLHERYQANLDWQNIQQVGQFLSQNELSNTYELSLQSCMINEKLFRELEKREFTSIIKLNLSFNELSNEGIDNLRYFPNLKKLSLFKNQLTKEAVPEILGSVPAGLEELDLGLNHIGDDSGFRKLEKLERLQTLKLAGTGITEQGLATMRVGKPLHTIDLSGNKIGNKLLSILSKWKNRLREINASRNNISRIEANDSDFPCLRKLILCANSLQELGLDFFPAFKSLKWLDLSKNKDIEDIIGDKKSLEKFAKKINLKYQSKNDQIIFSL